MTNLKATPGPWHARRYVGREDNWFVRGASNERVCGQASGPVTEPNARLIAEAPAMYEALEASRKIITDAIEEGLFGAMPLAANVALNKIEAILARVRGEQ